MRSPRSLLHSVAMAVEGYCGAPAEWRPVAVRTVPRSSARCTLGHTETPWTCARGGAAARGFGRAVVTCVCVLSTTPSLRTYWREIVFACRRVQARCRRRENILWTIKRTDVIDTVNIIIKPMIKPYSCIGGPAPRESSSSKAYAVKRSG
eukprot:7376408-Prymnesium_polylepis.2